MPRTSYGEEKRDQAWQLVETLMKRQGTQGVHLHRGDEGQFHLTVKASLLDMKNWAKDKLTTEQVREAITMHLGERFLGILLDQRTQKSGRGAEQWKFELRLWSTDLDENKRQFETAWQIAKSGNSDQMARLKSQISSNVLLTPPQQGKDLESILRQVQEHCHQKILNQHSKMRLLSGEEIGVDQLYVDVWLLNRSPRTFQISPDELLNTFDLRKDRLGLGDRVKRKPGFDFAQEKEKLVILGKPGSGKTTFLKHLAMDWCKGKFLSDLITVLVELRQIRDDGWTLLREIDKELGLENWDQLQELEEKILDESNREEKDNTQIEVLQQQKKALPLAILLEQGKLLVLMDGLDEVPMAEMRQKVKLQLEDIVKRYPKNRFILTCRTQIIVSIPVGFTLVEVADFNKEQVKQFVQNWFSVGSQLSTEATQHWKTFNNAVEKNPALKELTVTPVLLSLICLVMQDEGEIPSQITWLYKKGIKLLLSKWNDAKDIDGWEVGSKTYQKLSIEQKEALLTEIAAHKFENPDNFVLFEQDEIVAQLSKSLQLASYKEGRDILKSIEIQHGLLIERADELWSFSHLTFQEHFTIQWLNKLPIKELAEKIANHRWQEGLQQLVKTQQPADRLLRLIKQAIDQSISSQSNLQKFLVWVFQKSNSIRTNYKPEAIRALYFAIGLTLDRDFVRDFALDPVFVIDLALELDLANFVSDLNLNLPESFYFDCNPALIIDSDFDTVDDLAITLAVSTEFISVHTRARTYIHDLECLDIKHARDLSLDQELLSELDLDLDLVSSLDLNLESDCNRILNLTVNRALDPERANKLEQIKKAMSTRSAERIFQEWWQVNGTKWIEELRHLMIEHCNIGHNWQFTKEQKQQLQRYYDANKFLVNLINIEGAVSSNVRTEIEKTLLLPWKEP